MTADSRNERKELFKQVALTQLQSRSIAVFKASAERSEVSQAFLDDVATITEALLTSSHKFANYVSKDPVESVDPVERTEAMQNALETHQQYITSITVKA